MSTRLSIIICTRDRAAALRETLAALSQVAIPDGMEAEVVLADNGSSDDTTSVWDASTRVLQSAGFTTCYVLEKRRGQCHARNSGLATSRGDIIVFTDDDVRPSRGWLMEMSTPIASGQADALVGGVRLAPHLKRPWMTAFHRSWLASTEDEYNQTGEPGRLVGANMAFARRVLEKVPGFDTELGPGQLGFCDDILFSLQLKEAGYRLTANWRAEVEHHPDASRLQRAPLLQRARDEGRSAAYFWYHWLHHPVPVPHLKAAALSLKLAALRRHENPDPDSEGCSEAEMRLVQKLHCYRHYLVERQRPRNYDLRGLVKKSLETWS